MKFLSTLLTVWEILFSLSVLFSAISVPLKISFQAVDTVVLDWLIRSTDIVCWIDMFVGLLTPYELDGVIVSSRRDIFKVYIRSRFTVDIISSIPYDLFISNYSPFEIFICLVSQLLRLTRLQRMRALENQMSRLQYLIENKLVWVLMYVFKLLALLLIICHWLACIWFYIGLHSSNYSVSWFSTTFITADSSFSDCYIASLYFCMTVVLTVGFDDFHATNSSEQLFVVFMMATGWVILLVIAAMLTSTIVRYDEVNFLN